VIPNAVDTSKFLPPKPDFVKSKEGRINVVVLCRMTFRKGVDLLIDIIPEVVRRHSNVHFLIAGDGPKLNLLEEIRDKYNLGERMELIGKVPHT